MLQAAEMSQDKYRRGGGASPSDTKKGGHGPLASLFMTSVDVVRAKLVNQGLSVDDERLPSVCE